MRKLLVTALMFLGVFVLTGCDEFGFNDDEFNLWYDEPQQTLHVSYSFSKPAEDEETGELPVEFIYLMMFDKDLNEWVQIHKFDAYKVDDELIPFDYSVYGDLEFKVIKTDEFGETLLESPTMNIYINEPQFIYHFDTWFDNWSGRVEFNFGVNEYDVSSVFIEKSMDGGNTWEQILDTEIVLNEDGFIKGQLEYYEFEEGKYVYRLTALNENNEVVDTMDSWGEIDVYFEHKNFEGDPEVWYVGGNFDPYSNSVNIWWDGAGDFEGFVVEKSIDLINWEMVAELPRIAHSFSYIEEFDGDYFYKVSAVTGNAPLAFYISDEAVRVKEDALIGGFNGWVQWDNNDINLDWYFIKDHVHQVVLERRLFDGEFEVIGDFGALKTMFTDTGLQPGIYVYRLSLVNEDGELLDSLESGEFEVVKPEHVHHLNAWHNQSTGEIEFDFSFNFEYVSYYVIEKSSDGGLTWEQFTMMNVEIDEYNNYVQNIRVYELTEGSYAYRITGYDEIGNDVGTAYSWNEVYVNYDNLNLEDPIDMYYLEAHTNIWDNSVYLWWGSQGTYDEHLVEYSSDGETWLHYTTVPRVTQGIQIKDLLDGEYFFRISCVKDGFVEDDYTTEYKVRVKEDAYIGSFKGYQEWNNNVYLYWDIIKDNVALITIERKLDTDIDFTFVAEFGPLKTQFVEDVEAGTYVYRITLLDENGNVLDQLESNEIEVYYNSDNY